MTNIEIYKTVILVTLGWNIGNLLLIVNKKRSIDTVSKEITDNIIFAIGLIICFAIQMPK